MQPKLKEDPREWLKFTAVMAVAGIGLAALLWYRRVLGGQVFGMISLAFVLAVAACAASPRWFRGFYRVGMTASFHVGQVMGRILLSLIFLAVVTPLGLLLRILGKDLLQLRRDSQAPSHWRKARPPGPLDRQF